MRALVLAALFALPASAMHETGMHCENRLVVLGDRKYEVQDRCGPATFADQRVEARLAPDGTPVPVTVDEWVYDFGPNRFVRTLFFENGRLVRIKVGDYGSSKG